MRGFLYSGEELFKQRLEDFASFGELGKHGVEEHVLFSSQSTEINDGPSEVIFEAMSKLQPFEGKYKRQK